MKAYSNLVEGLNDLKKKGYTLDFNLKENCLICSSISKKMYPEDFKIDLWYRLEGDDSSADGSSTIYAISSEKYGLKGTLVNASGIYTNQVADALLHKLKFSS